MRVLVGALGFAVIFAGACHAGEDAARGPPPSEGANGEDQELRATRVAVSGISMAVPAAMVSVTAAPTAAVSTSMMTMIRSSGVEPPPGGGFGGGIRPGGRPAGRPEFAPLAIPRLTAPSFPIITAPPPVGLGELGKQAGIGLGNLVGSLVSPLVAPIQSLVGGLTEGLGGGSGQLNRPPPGRGFGNPFGGPAKGPGFPFGKGPRGDAGMFDDRHVKCSQQEVSCSFLKEAAYQMQNDDDHCLKIATSFDQEGKIKFDPLAQDSDNVIYGITTDGLTASAWCNDIGWALRKIYNGCRQGKQCFGGDSYAARNAAFMVTVGPRDKGPRINVKLTNLTDSSSQAMPDISMSTKNSETERTTLLPAPS